jgi:hypothetical protein
MNKIIDLHTHTTNSDGTNTTAELIEKAINLGIDILSITDHNSVGAYYELKRTCSNPKKPLTVIVGVELSFQMDGMPRHILGYGFDVDAMNKYLKKRYTPEYRLKKQRSILEKFHAICKAKGMEIDDLDVLTGAESEAFTVVMDALLKYPQNLVNFPELEDKFYWYHFQNPQSEYFVSMTQGYPTMQEVIDLIHKTGGLAFIAHPFHYERNEANAIAIVNAAIACGIDGVEVGHSSNIDNDVEILTKIAKENNLYICGGSDYHGCCLPINLVTGRNNMRVDFAEIAPWFDLVRKIEL